TRHAVAKRRAEADLVERIGTIDALDRGCRERREDALARRGADLDDVLLARDHDARRRQRDEDLGAGGIAEAIVDQHELGAARRRARPPPKRAAVAGEIGHTPAAAGPPDDGPLSGSGASAPHAPADHAEALDFVVTHEHLAALANDHALIGLDDHGALPVV